MAERLDAAIRAILVVLSVVFVVALFAVAFARLGYRYELEWMGGAFADHVDRVLRGLPIYVEPTLDFVPFLYTPLFFWFSAGLARVVGEGFVPLRLTSILATCGTLLLLLLVVRRTTGRWLPAIVAVGLWAACYDLVDSWYDTSRADSLFVFFLLASLALLLRGGGARSAALAGVLLTLAYFSKQTALLLAVPFAVATGLRGPRRGLVFASTFALVCGTAVLVVDWLHDGWFTFYTWTLPRRHEYIEQPLYDFFRRDVVPLYPTVLLGMWLLIDHWWHGRRRAALAFAAWWLGLMAAGISSRMHVGGAENVLMPTFLGLCLAAGLALGAAADGARPRLAGAVSLLLAAQLALLVYDPRPYVPTAADEDAGDRLVRILRETEGEVMVPLHGYLPKLAGKRGSAHAMAMLDVVRGAEPDLAQRLEQEYWDSGRTRGVELIVLDDNCGEFARLVVPGYRSDGPLFPPRPDRTFVPVVGLAARPQYLFRRVR